MGKNGKMLFETVKSLRLAQGFYSRMWARLENLTVEDWEELEEQLPEFNDGMDVIMFLEG